MEITSNTALPKGDAKTLNAWCSYDWANSVYNLIVTTAIFPIYYGAATREAFGGEEVMFFGLAVKSSVLYTYAISFSFLVVVLLSPVLSGIADYGGRKKSFMQFFTYLGATACIGLFFFEGSNIEYGIICAILASIGYAGSLVFYNAFLPEIATEDQMDRISARGFALGYIGSVILLLINLITIIFYQELGFQNKTAPTQWAFVLVGIWWAGFAQIAFLRLKNRPTGKAMDASVLGKGLNEIRKVFVKISEVVVTKRFLLAFFCYSMGVQTVMLLAPLFGENEIGMESDEMIVVVLILQLLAIIGAWFFARISDWKGNKVSISLTLTVWIFICVAAYFLQSKTSFYLLAGLLGFVMGGIQSMSRSTYAKLVPQGTVDTASYFSFYDITEKIAIVLGTLTYGIIEQLTNSMRNSILTMTIFFVAGLLLLSYTKLPFTRKQKA